MCTPLLSNRTHCTPSNLTLLKDQQADAGGPAHYVRWVLGVAGEGAVVAEIQVLDQDGAITTAGVPHKLHAVPEWSLVVDIGGTTSVVEDLLRTRGDIVLLYACGVTIMTQEQVRHLPIFCLSVVFIKKHYADEKLLNAALGSTVGFFLLLLLVLGLFSLFQIVAVVYIGCN